VVNTLGGFLIETGDQKIVVDLGFGDATFEIPDSAVFSGGRFLESLSRTKVDPADVDLLLFTHLHVDHTGWTSVPDSDGRRLTFPNARHFVGSGELSF
jgi:glyoxylase-like metal-dependent hydrolase (beta-lactamase superfamily II)